MNTSETPPDGVWFRNSPHTSDTDRVTGHGVYINEQVQLRCYSWGDAVGPYNNTLWYDVLNVTRPTNAGVENSGFLNAHYINDGLLANQIDAGVPDCSTPTPTTAPTPTTSPPPHVAPCVFDMRWNTHALTFSYSGKHRYYGNAWQGAKNWTNLNTGIQITPAPSGQTGNIVFDDTYAPAGKYYGRAEVPDGWQGPYNSIPNYFHTPSTIHILVNQAYMDPTKYDKYRGATDFQRTAALTHELGHALGLAHSDACGITAASIMHSGSAYLFSQTWNTPQYYDKIELEELYGLPTG